MRTALSSPLDLRTLPKNRKSYTFSKLEFLVVGIKDRYVWSRGSNEGRPIIVISNKLHSFLGWDTIARDEHNSMGNISEEAKIFQSHLTGPIFSDTASWVGANQFDWVSTNTCYSDLICSSWEESREGRAEGDFIPAGKTSTDPH